MKAALIVMMIMGCDDSETVCNYLDTVNQSWQTVAACDAQADAVIARHKNENYPVIAAVCKTSGDNQMEDVAETAPTTDQGFDVPDFSTTAAEKQGIADRTLAFVRKALPTRASLSAAVTTPVHYAENGYHWVVRRFVN
jgi:hypothetical protein